ncbi:hypothetical protein ACU4GG_28135 [Streptomyces nojiriensis]
MSTRGLRVLHAVTLHSPSHAFGGPVRVALNLAKGLRARGHEARLLALSEGFDEPWPDSVEGCPRGCSRPAGSCPSASAG